NGSYNGAGVRINQANDVTIRNCVIRNNDMGIMSNGNVSQQSGARQLIEKCVITDNGTIRDPGYNHNLYLGGTSVTVRHCEIARAVTGHNVKSRAHLNYIIACHIHSSANREFDLVDERGNTDVPGSDSFLINNLIEKNPRSTGNKAVAHFGRDGNAIHNGTVWLIGNTIRTPFISPVVDVSSGNGAVFVDNEIDDTGARQRGVLATLRDNMAVSGKDNKIPERFVVSSPRGEQSPIQLNVPPPLPNGIEKLREVVLERK
ncbi:MAG: right-handed parallel beta-helix repeat-containing protein, partial [Planctomycetaceae bacterium]|nr:right-handed parallel beta-helix repeat-containing protein [Planctomycetaceae bacterium]